MALITIFLKNAINKNCSEFNKKIFWEIFFSGIPDPDFGPDSTFSGFSEFFDFIAYIKHLCRRIFELYQIVSLWTGTYVLHNLPTVPCVHILEIQNLTGRNL